MSKIKKVKFWAGKTEVILNLPGLTDQEIYEEFLSWLVQEANAGFEIIQDEEEELDHETGNN